MPRGRKKRGERGGERNERGARPRPVPRPPDDAFPPRSKPLEAKGGIRPQSRGGDFGSTWWAKRWQAMLERFGFSGRMARGRSYARDGQVLSVDVRTGQVTARVQGSRPEPYDVRIGVKQLTPGQWGKVVEALSQKALFVAKLLAGDMPQDIEDAFTGSRLSLFPEKRRDLETSCTCPDEANPCKHIAAVYYLLGEEFDRDPFLIFRLRGLGREELLGRLSKNATSAQAAPAGEPLSVDTAAFWALPPDAEDYGEVQAPPVTAGVLRRLGGFPFWRGARPLLEALEPAYVQAGALGLEVFLGEKGEA